MPENKEKIYRSLLVSIGENLDRDGLKATPKRAARAFEHLTVGYSQNIDEVINGAIFESDNDEMIIVKDIEMYSLCEHHLLPFFGKCHIGYIPRGKVMGLSKLARVVDVYAKRLQIQENLTKQVADTIMKYTNAYGVGVVIEAKHLCMMMRGVEKQNSVMKTSCMLGVFRSQGTTRSEFLSLIK
ncbi:MAG: GTP cyclohydrolase I FolE [Candidatus Omnitrophica bacterium]|nr:GTP cyclohydrolase I FolE [Candidatus Omnitrophota bacterium]